MSDLQPTPEQQDIIDTWDRGGSMVIEAGAGTGKTSTLRLLAQRPSSGRTLYLAFNKAIADEAQTKFPRGVEVRTANAFAMRQLGRRDPRMAAILDRLPPRAGQPARGELVRSSAVARWLGINSALAVGEQQQLQPSTIARHALNTLTAWCYSADPDLTTRHVPPLEGVDAASAAMLAEHVVPFVRRLWADALASDGKWRTSHDMYMKVFQLALAEHPDAYGFDTILYDEAQDANGAMSAAVKSMAQAGARPVVIGDSAQRIYGWRGATDALATWPADHRKTLSTSFRFGPAIATEANRWLGRLHSNLTLTGTATIESRLVSGMRDAEAILCRTNGAAMEQVIDAIARRRSATLVGGTHDIERFAKAVIDLREYGSTDHPDLCEFPSWGAVVDYVENDGGGELKSLVDLVNTHTAEGVLRHLRAMTRHETDADVIVSTAHKAKGREWNRVKVAGDFTGPTTGQSIADMSSEELCLAYVTVTRAREQLDRGSLAWLDAYVTQPSTVHRVGPTDPATQPAPPRERIMRSAPPLAAENTPGGYISRFGSSDAYPGPPVSADLPQATPPAGVVPAVTDATPAPVTGSLTTGVLDVQAGRRPFVTTVHDTTWTLLARLALQQGTGNPTQLAADLLDQAVAHAAEQAGLTTGAHA